MIYIGIIFLTYGDKYLCVKPNTIVAEHFSDFISVYFFKLFLFFL